MSKGCSSTGTKVPVRVNTLKGSEGGRLFLSSGTLMPRSCKACLLYRLCMAGSVYVMMVPKGDCSMAAASSTWVLWWRPISPIRLSRSSSASRMREVAWERRRLAYTINAMAPMTATAPAKASHSQSARRGGGASQRCSMARMSERSRALIVSFSLSKSASFPCLTAMRRVMPGKRSTS